MQLKGLMGIAKLGVVFSALAIVILLGMSSISVKAPSANMFSGNAVYINDSNAFIQVQPHTIRDSQWVYINATAKQFTGNVDFAVLTDTEIIDFSKIELYNPITTITNRSYTCNGDYFNYTVSPKYAWCWYNRTENIGTNSTPVFSSTVNGLLFGRAFEAGNAAAKTIYWSETSTKNYNAFPSAITSQAIDWNGLNKAYIAANLPMNAGQNYQVRIWADVKPNSNGKYWVAFKPSAETISQAIASNHLYYIDPWWNTSYAYTQTFQVNQTISIRGWNSTHNYPKAVYMINVSNVVYNASAATKYGFDTASLISAGKLDANCGGLRVVNETNSTVLNYEIESCNSANTIIYVSPDYPITNTNGTTQQFRLFYGDTDNSTGDVHGSVWESSGVKKTLAVYTFGKNGTGVVNDSTIFGRNATLGVNTGDGNAKVNSSGLFGNALFLSGAADNSNMTIPMEVWNDIQDNLTAAVWFKEDGVSAGTHSQLFFKGKSGSSGDFQVLVTGVQTSCGITTSSYVEPAIAMRPFNNQWHYYVCTYDGANIKEYIDGLLVASGAQTGVVRKSADMAFSFGTNEYGGNRDFRGLIDNMVILNYSLSAEEINETYVSTISYLVGAEEGQPPASTPTFSTTEFTDRFDYVSTVDAGFTGNYTNGTTTIDSGTPSANIASINLNSMLVMNVSTPNPTNAFTFYQNLNTSKARFVDGKLKIKISNTSTGCIACDASIHFLQSSNGTAYALRYVANTNSLSLVQKDDEYSSPYRLESMSTTKATAGVSAGFIDAQIIANNSKFKIILNNMFAFAMNDSVVDGSTNGTVTLSVYSTGVAFIGSIFDDLIIQQETSPTLSDITNNGTGASITKFSIMSTVLNTNTSSCILQYVTTNYTMTRTSGTDLFTYTLGSKPAGTNNYNFLCNSTTATNGWTNTTISAIYSETISTQPIFASNQTSFPATYNPSTNTILNVSWFGTINGTSIFQINNTNYTSTYNGSYTNSSWSGVLGAGAYNWTAWIIDGNGNGNRTDYYTFTIQKATPILALSQNNTFGTASGLVGYWSLDENTTNLVHDQSGFGNDGDFNNSAKLNASGKFGGGVSFSGASDQVNLGTNLRYILTEGFTVSVWVKLDRSSDTNKVIIGKFVDNSQSPGWKITQSDFANRIKFYYNSTTCDTGAGANMASNQWYHATETVNLTHVTGYIDGVYRCSALHGLFKIPNDKSGSLTLGDTIYSGFENNIAFKGLIDEVRIYNYTMTEAEINISARGIMNDMAITYPNATNVTGYSRLGDASAIKILYRNGTEIGRANESILLAAGIYEYNLTYPETQNYTAKNITRILTINKGALSFNLYLNGTEGNANYVYFNDTNATGTITPRLNNEGNFNLLRNGTSIGTSINADTLEERIRFGTGIYNYSLNASGFQNYTITDILSGRILTIMQGVLTGNLYVNGTQASQIWTYPNATNVTAIIGSRLNNEGTFNLLRNGTSIGILNGANFAMNESVLGASIYNFTAAWVGSNYTFTNITYALTINKSPISAAITNTTLEFRNIGKAFTSFLYVNFTGTDDSQNYSSRSGIAANFSQLGNLTRFTNTSVWFELGNVTSPVYRNITINMTDGSSITYNVSLVFSLSGYYQNESGTANRTYQLIAYNTSFSQLSAQPLNITYSILSPDNSVNLTTGVMNGTRNVLTQNTVMINKTVWYGDWIEERKQNLTLITELQPFGAIYTDNIINALYNVSVNSSIRIVNFTNVWLGSEFFYNSTRYQNTTPANLTVSVSFNTYTTLLINVTNATQHTHVYDAGNYTLSSSVVSPFVKKTYLASIVVNETEIIRKNTVCYEIPIERLTQWNIRDDALTQWFIDSNTYNVSRNYSATNNTLCAGTKHDGGNSLNETIHSFELSYYLPAPGAGNPPGGGGSGSTSSGVAIPANFTIEPVKLQVVIPKGQSGEREFKITNTGTKLISLSVIFNGEYASYAKVTSIMKGNEFLIVGTGQPQNVVVDPGTTRIIKIGITMPENAKGGETIGVSFKDSGTASELVTTIELQPSPVPEIIQWLGDTTAKRLSWGVTVKPSCATNQKTTMLSVISFGTTETGLCLEGAQPISIPYVGALIVFLIFVGSNIGLKKIKELKDDKLTVTILSLGIALLVMLTLPIA